MMMKLLHKRLLKALVCGLTAVFLVVGSEPVVGQDDRISYVPSIDYKSFLVKKAVRTSKKRDRVINILKDLLKLYPSGEEKAQLEIRLAQLYLDKARHLYFLELYKSDPDAQKALEGELALERKSTKGLKLKTSFAYNREAIKIYRRVLKTYPKLENRDEVMFYLGYNLGEIGKNKEAVSLYRSLIKKYPKSSYVPEAYLVQGEYFFYSNKIPQALKYYKQVRRYPNSQVRDLAEYKIAWCYFNLGNIGTALKTTEQLILTPSNTTAALDLREEAIRDLVVMFMLWWLLQRGAILL